MNKEKAKNITLGVSLILNLLGSLLIGGSLIHACNASPRPEKADLSPVSLALGKMDGLSPLKAENGVLSAGTYLLNQTIGVSSMSSGETADFEFICNGVTYNRFYFRYVAPSGGGGKFTASPNNVATASNRLYYVTADLSTYDLAYQYDGGWTDEAFRTIDVVNSPGDQSSMFVDWFTSNAIYQGGVSSSSSESSASSDVSSSSCEDASSSTTSVDQPMYDVVKVPETFWGYRVLNGSPDSNTGGAFVTNEITDIWSGGVRLRGLSFYLGDSETEYNGVEFYYWNFFGRDFVNEKGDITRASSDGFKNVLYLDHVSVHPATSTDYDDASTWQVIGSAIYGMNDSGSLYVNAHGFNWLDQSYKSFRVRVSSVNAYPFLAYSGSATGSFVNPIIKNSLTITEAFRLSLTGTSADVSGGAVIGGNGYADVFSLIGSAFSSLVPILSVQVLPYLTIGTLMLVPLIVLVIFAILKVLNK